MAILETIRNKYAKVAGGVIALSLVGFVLMDATSGGRGGGLFGSNTAIGSVNGEDIDYKEFETAFQNYEAQYKQQMGVQGLDDATTASLRDQVWNQFINQKILDDIYEKLGISVSAQELEDMISGPNPDPQIVQIFTQGGQAFDPVAVANQIAQIKADAKTKAQWDALEKDMISRKMYNKFSTLVSKGVYVPKFMLDRDAEQRESYAKVDFVQVPFSTIADADVKPTDEELKSYMQAHKAMFQQKENSRSISYVSFAVKPNSADSAKVLESLNSIKEEFATTPSTTEEINQFVGINSDKQDVPTYYTREQLNSYANAEEIWNAPTGTVYGPMVNGNTFVLSKTLSKATYPDSVKLRHVVIAASNNGQQIMDSATAKAKIDTVAALAKAGTPFHKLVSDYSANKPQQPSADTTAPENNGELDFTLAQKAYIPEELSDFAFNGKAGDTKVIHIKNAQIDAYYYVEILSTKNPTSVAKIAFITKELSPSSDAFSEAYNTATAFANKATTAEAFETTAREMGTAPSPAGNINFNSSVISGLGASRDLVNWAYKAKMGDVSNIITVGEKYVVAKLTGVQEKGILALTDENRPSIEYMVMNQKKAKAIIEKNKANTSLASLATANNTTIGSADSVNYLQSFIPGIGVENKVIGYVFGANTKPNTLSPGIPGNNAVFFVDVKEAYKVAGQPRNEAMERKMAQSQVEANITNAVISNLRDSYKVEDKRGEFFK